MESTLTYTFEDLYKDVAEYMGIGRSPSGTNLTTVKRRVNDAYRQFLAVNDWRFLRKSSILRVSTATGWEVELPDDFADLRTKFKYAPDEGGWDVDETDEDTILAARSGSGSTSGRPCLFAIRARPYSAGIKSVKYEAIFYPTPGSSYNLYYSYYRVVDELSDDDSVPICGPEYSQLLRAYCLAEVEKFDDEMPASWTAQLPVLVAQAIKKDSKKAARSVGMMGGTSVGFDRILRVTYNDVEY